MAPQLYVLYEHASGYSLFYVHEVEEVGALLPTVERAITDLSLFMSAVKLIAFSPFKSGTNALDNINAISEGILNEDLKLFLETNVPTGKKAKKEGGIELGVMDTRITATIQEQLGIQCATGDAVSEVLRGLRLHFPNMVKGLTPLGEAKAQLGLGHSYSRAKVKFNIHRADNMIIQSIALLDQLDKDINTFAMRVREWYSYHFPEMIKIASENYQYCRLAKLIGNRKCIMSATEEMKEKIEEITMDSAKAEAIISASKMSMGMDISPIDLINIECFATRVISLADYRKSLVSYLHKRMTSVAPSLSALIGDMVGARLISHAGSLTNLAKYPASTVQILGAEKALFRALKTKGNTPKYGLIFHSTFIGRAAAKNKGRISRYLANKCSMASRIDCFTENPSTIYGEKLRDQVEERLKFFDSGEAPRKNIDVMKEAVKEAGLQVKALESEEADGDTKEKKKKKKKKRKSAVEGEVDISQVVSDDDDNVSTPAKRAKLEESDEDVQSSKKKKKKKKQDADTSQVNGSSQEEEMSVNNSTVSVEGSAKKRKKKKLNGSSQEEEVNDSIISAGGSPKKSKKKKKLDKTQDEVSEGNISQSVEDSAKKLKKKKKKADTSLLEKTDNSMISVEGSPKKKAKVNGSSQDESTADENSVKKAKKKKKSLGESFQDSEANDSICEPTTKKLKKKKKKSIAE